MLIGPTLRNLFRLLWRQPESPILKQQEVAFHSLFPVGVTLPFPSCRHCLLALTDREASSDDPHKARKPCEWDERQEANAQNFEPT